MYGSVLIGFAFLVSMAAPPAQAPAPPASAPREPIVIGPPPPPATALEAFHAAPGDILTTAYEELGEVEGVLVEAREMRDPRGGQTRGIVVTIADQSHAEPDQAFVDPDEFDSLMKGFDALLAITVNPSAEFRNFDMRYSTRGELVLTASSTRLRGVAYGVEVGRTLRARRTLNGGEFHQLRTLVEAAQQKLATLANRRDPGPAGSARETRPR
ncbi:MAG TPA: hypothetical protein VGI12_05040 [Vicinamibacterales bacterium]|jgi:hypothetical protein